MALCLSFPIRLLWNNREMLLMKCLPKAASSGISHFPCGFFMSLFLAHGSVGDRLASLALGRLKPENHKFEDHPATYQVQGQPRLPNTTVSQKGG